ncbi:MAG TPA: FtsX-like permease family protein [Burkholderiales bacterium]
MRTPNRISLALRLLVRDWRAGELRLFVGAVAIAVGAVTTVGFFNDRLDRGLTQRSADLLGADYVLSTPAPPAGAWLEAARARGLEVAEAVEFPSVVIRGERLQLASVRAVGRGYPLRGTVRTAGALYQPGEPTPGQPAPGTAWAESRVLQALGIEPGETLELGNATFTVTRVLTDEPGRVGNFFALGPRVLIHLDDLAETGVIQPGSRVRYRTAFTGSERALAEYRAWLAPRLGPSDRLIEARAGNTTTARAVERIDSYFGLTSLLAVVLAGVAIAMGAHRYSQRHYDTSAMLRALGATQRDVLALYLPQFLVLGVGASALGCAAGLIAQQAIYYAVRDLFPVALPPPGAKPAFFGFATGLVTLAGFALVPVLRLRAVPPLRVLRRDLAPLPAAAWALAAAAAAALLLLVWSYTRDWTLTLAVLAGTAAGGALLFLLSLGLLRLARRLRRARGFWGRGVERLQRRLAASAGQILAFGFTLMAMAVIALVRTDLLSAWQAQLPDDAPNHFVFNIVPDDVAGVEGFFRAHAIASQALYPLVRGRLTQINGRPVRVAVTKEEDEEANNAALRRDLNLTWAAELPPDNRVVRGRWWDADAAPGAVSVEERLAERLGIGPGDRLTFTIAAQELEARVASVRKVQWESFHPNFFMIFSPGTLEGFPTTYMTSFHVPPAKKPLLAELVRQFPAVTVLELDQLLAQVRAIVRQAALAVEMVLLFVLAGGFTVLYAALATSLDERFYEGAVARTFGASRAYLRRGHLAEFMALGALAGLLAAAGTEAVAYVLYTQVLDLAYGWKWPVWIVAPVAGALVIGVAGYLGTRRVVERSPLTLLREA